jgi:hypothetical protein
MIQDAQAKIDGAVGAASIASPWWLQLFDHALHLYFMVGGGILLALRLANAIREWRRRR